MGAADIVPGVSGGTVALVLGIYERLVHNIHLGAEALKAVVTGRTKEFVPALKRVEWVWLLSLLAGVLTAVAVLSSVLEDLLHDYPVRMAGLFFGLVAGSVIVAWRLIGHRGTAEWSALVGVAVGLFLVLGLRSDTEVAEGTEEAVTQSPWVFFLAGALAICAMILPGISGSFILLLIGMYTEVLGAVNDRDVVVLGAFAAGCVVGLAIFSSILDWALTHHHDLVMSAMVGLMLGSMRVLWPWPGGTQTTDLDWPSDDIVWPVLLAILGFAAVMVVERFATPDEQPA